MNSKVIIVFGAVLLVMCLFLFPKICLKDNNYNDDLTKNIQDLKDILQRQQKIKVVNGMRNVVSDVKEKVDQKDISVLRYESGEWRYDYEICSGLAAKIRTKSFQKTTFKSDFVGNMPIYVHDPNVDGIASRILKSGNFEPHVFKTLHAFFVQDPEIGLIDIGANIGVNALQAALFGRHVVAMEATKESTQHLCASSTENNIQHKLIIVNNAVSNNHNPVKVVHAKMGGFGGAFLDEDPELHKLKIHHDGNVFNFTKYNIMKTVMLDDVLGLPNINAFKKVLIKMDVEGWEHKVFEGAQQFFKKVPVVGVLMEYRWHVGRPSKNIIIEFFKNFEYDPFSFKGGILRPLNAETMTDHDVLWLHRHRNFWKNAKEMNLW